jgi:hypothetical protein
MSKISSENTEAFNSALKEVMPAFHVDDAKTTTGELDLIGGYIDEKGNRLYQASMREMSGHEEDVLIDTKSPFHRRMAKILANCLDRISDGNGNHVTEKSHMPKVIDNITSVDKVQMLFWLRRISVPNGDIFTFIMNCPKCGNKFRYSVALDEMDYKPMKDPMIRVYEETLPSGKTARCHVMLGKHERKIADSVRTNKDFFTAQIMARVSELDGNPATIYALKSLTLRDRQYLRDRFDEIEGNVDTSIEVICDRCNTEFDGDIDVSSKDFFFPSGTESS